MGLKKSLEKYEIFKDGTFLHVILLGFSFTLIFTAFQTTAIIEQTVLSSVKNSDSNFTGDGYISLAIIYGVFGISTWIAPSVVEIVQPKWSMFLSALFYIIFISGFIFPTTWFLYLSSILIGFGAGILWTAQGTYLTNASTPETISRNSGVFWALMQLSLFFGNTFVYFQFNGKTIIDSETRVFVFIVLSIVATSSLVCIFFMKNFKTDLHKESNKKNRDMDNNSIEVNSNSTQVVNGVMDKAKGDENTSSGGGPPDVNLNLPIPQRVWQDLKNSAKLLITPHMLLLSLACIYTGLELSFWSGVYPTAIGFTKKFGSEAKRLVGLIGILIGVGEIVGGALFGILGSKTTKKGRTPIILLGLTTHIVAYILIYLNLPHESPLISTEDHSIINPPIPGIGLLCAFLLGFGDACYQTQLISIFGSVYSKQSSSAFALFRFTQSLAGAVAFFYSTQFGLLTHMIILVVTCLFGSAGFIYVELRTRKNQANSNQSTQEEMLQKSEKNSIEEPKTEQEKEKPTLEIESQIALN